MYPENRPLQTLAAFALTFAAGMVATAALSAYANWVHKRARQQALTSPE